MVVALFTVVGTSLLVAAFCGAPLVEDGAYYLVVMLESGVPAVPHGRDLNRLLQAPALYAMERSDNIDLIIKAFSLPYVLVPWMALLSCYWIVRRRAARLFLWPSVGILLINLPMQIIFIAESTHAICAFWVVWSFYLVSITPVDIHRPASSLSTTSRPRLRTAATILLTLAAALACVWSHPVAIILFVAGFLLAAFTAVLCWGNRDQRRIHTGWALAFLGFAGLSGVRLMQVWNDYAREETNSQVLQDVFWLGWRTAPIGALGLSIGAALLVSINSGLARMADLDRQPVGRLASLRSRFVRWSAFLGDSRILNRAAVALLLFSSILFIIWASEPQMWRWSISFRRFYPLFMLPILGASLWDAMMTTDLRDDRVRRIDAGRRALITGAGAAFAIVITIQSLQWAAFGRTVLNTLMSRPALYQGWESEPWLEVSPILGWTLPSYSLLLQGKHPQRIYLNAPFLPEAEQGLGLRIAPWDLKSFDGRWFDFSALSPAPPPQ